MTEKLFGVKELRKIAFEFHPNGKPCMHKGAAKKIYKLKLPMKVEVAQALFALLSVDDTLPKGSRKKKRKKEKENKTMMMGSSSSSSSKNKKL